MTQLTVGLFSQDFHSRQPGLASARPIVQYFTGHSKIEGPSSNWLMTATLQPVKVLFRSINHGAFLTNFLGHLLVVIGKNKGLLLVDR